MTDREMLERIERLEKALRPFADDPVAGFAKPNLVMATFNGQLCKDARDALAPLPEKPAVPEGICELCGLQMLESEKMFKYHGYSETCEQAKARTEKGSP